MINPYVMKIIVAARDEDSINGISKRTGISFGWTRRWVKELAKAGVFTLDRMKLTINKQNEVYRKTLAYIKDMFGGDISFYYSVLSWMGITYCFTKTDAVFVWTKGGYQIGRSMDWYPIFVKIKEKDRETFEYYVRKLGFRIGSGKLFYRPEFLEKFPIEFCEDIPVDPLKDTIRFMQKYVYNFEPALEMIQKMYHVDLGVKYEEAETNA